MILPLRVLALLLMVFPVGCVPSRPDEGDSVGARTGREPYDAFYEQLSQLCGQAYPGRITVGDPRDPALVHGPLIAHFFQCGPRRIRIAFHAGSDRSRVWVVERIRGGLLLLHDRHESDGRPSTITGYGGPSTGGGSAFVQRFDANASTLAMVPASRHNLWTLIVEPGDAFVYDLLRRDNEQRFRVEFDLSRPLPLPPPAWGYGPPNAEGAPPAEG